jgi:catechol 2,3-dioxygenase-like lactoylglutathione lyase family enzyme
MKIKLTSIYVDDQDKALRFYTEVLGFVKKADFRSFLRFSEPPSQAAVLTVGSGAISRVGWGWFGRGCS